MLIALVAFVLVAEPGAAADAPRSRPEEKRAVSNNPLFNISLLFGAAAWRQTVAGAESPQFTFGVRTEAFASHKHVGFGGHVLVESTIGRDFVVGLGPAMLISGGHDINHWLPPIQGSGLSIFPSFYMRDGGGRNWQPGVGLGLALRWADRFGVGVDGRFGLGPNAERAVLVTAQLDVLTPLFLGLWIGARKVDPGTWI